MKIKISDITEGKLTQEQTESLQKYFKEGGTWGELLQLKPEEVEEVYAVGYEHYAKGEYDKALTSFSALIQLNPYEAKHWIAVGAALQAQGAHGDAIVAYEVALTIDENHAAALFYSAQCTYSLGQKEESKSFLKRVMAAEDPEFSEKAKRILNVLEQEK